MTGDFPAHRDDAAFARLTSYFRAQDYHFHADPETCSVVLFISGACALYNCRLQLTHGGDLLQIRVHWPVSAKDHELRPCVAEALARANHGMPVGKFEIDMDCGEIGYQLAQAVPAEGLDDRLIGGVFSTALATSDRYFPAVMRVMFAGYTPADAVYLCELDVHSEALEAAEPPIAPRPPQPRTEDLPSGPQDTAPDQTGELPGLFEPPPARRRKRPRR